MTKPNRYAQLIEKVFCDHYKKRVSEFEFEREEIERHAAKLNIGLPKNLGDLIYSFRYRSALPKKIMQSAPAGKEWLILPAGRSRYRFVLMGKAPIHANDLLIETRIPDATPGIIAMYALSDEQALLAKLRYNRLIDIFCRVATYALQSHLRTSIPGIGQVETDEVYVGLHRKGAHYVFPVQAKSGKDKLSMVQIYQDVAMCRHKFPSLICRPIGAQFMGDGAIVLFEFTEEGNGIRLVSEEHYRLVPPENLTPADLDRYRAMTQE